MKSCLNLDGKLLHIMELTGINKSNKSIPNQFVTNRILQVNIYIHVLLNISMTLIIFFAAYKKLVT